LDFGRERGFTTADRSPKDEMLPFRQALGEILRNGTKASWDRHVLFASGSERDSRYRTTNTAQRA
jgi:hypothetical protein